MKVLVTEPIHASGVDFLKSKGVEVDCRFGIARNELLEIVHDYDALVIRSDTPVNEELLSVADKLKAVGMAGIGLNHIDLNLCKEKGIAVFNVPEGSIESVAELTLGFLISAARRIVKASHDTKNGIWNKSAYMGNTLQGKTLGILALGKIGTRVVELVAPLSMKVLAYDPFLTPETAALRGAELVTLDKLLEESDFVSIHTPLTPETFHLIGAEELAKMKKSAYICNLGRGGVIDEEALYDALVSGQIAGAALDVLQTEPNHDSKLFQLDNVFITPHIGAGTVESQKTISETVTEEVYNHLSK